MPRTLLVALGGLALAGCGSSPVQFTLTVVRNGEGTIRSSPSGIICGATCSARFARGTRVTLAAEPAAGFSFGGWSGACSGTEACSIVLVADAELSAAFAPPRSVPGEPRDIVAAAGVGQATLTWRAPASDGGAPIERYVVAAAPGSASVEAAGTALSATVTGLANGTAYTFTVRAGNAIGLGPASAPSAPVTPRGPPARPGGVTAAGGVRAAAVNWTAPADNGSAISGYKVFQSLDAGAPVQSAASITGTSAAVTGLLAGRRYSFSVLATNAIGDGPLSEASAQVRLIDRPGAPAITKVTRGSGQVLLEWSAPASTDPIDGYTWTSSSGSTGSTGGTVRSATITGLANGTPTPSPSRPRTPSATAIPPLHRRR